MKKYIVIDGKDVVLMDEKDMRVEDFYVDSVLRVTCPDGEITVEHISLTMSSRETRSWP